MRDLTTLPLGYSLWEPKPSKRFKTKKNPNYLYKNNLVHNQLKLETGQFNEPQKRNELHISIPTKIIERH